MPGYDNKYVKRDKPYYASKGTLGRKPSSKKKKKK